MEGVKALTSSCAVKMEPATKHTKSYKERSRAKSFGSFESESHQKSKLRVDTRRLSVPDKLQRIESTRLKAPTEDPRFLRLIELLEPVREIDTKDAEDANEDEKQTL